MSSMEVCKVIPAEQLKRILDLYLLPSRSNPNCIEKHFVNLFSIQSKVANIINSMDVKRIHGNTEKVFLHALTFEQKGSALNWIKTIANDHGEPRPGRMYTLVDRTRHV
eukprot:NODE_609_length_6055_cov_0.342622.p3 type:complete len:109 gc:universal NODE_609_length_6055_cov_0.342622:2800-3126(+)